MIGTPKFSPRLELTKIAVGSLVKRPQRTVDCRTVVECDKAAGGPVQSMKIQLPPMFVSYQLTGSLQRSITKAMRKRRRDQEGSLKDKRKPLNQKKSVYPRRRHLQRPASAACMATNPAVDCGDIEELDPSGGVDSVMEEELEIQQDAIIQPIQVRIHAGMLIPTFICYHFCSWGVERDAPHSILIRIVVFIWRYW